MSRRKSPTISGAIVKSAETPRGPQPFLTTDEAIVARLNAILRLDRSGITALMLGGVQSTPELARSGLCTVDPKGGLSGLGILSALFPLWPQGGSRIAALQDEHTGLISRFVITNADRCPSDRVLAEDPFSQAPGFAGWLPPSTAPALPPVIDSKRLISGRNGDDGKR